MSILSIQSHVSYGHVGNAAGVFILQRMGFDVWPVHTVLFSNHPGYGGFAGCTVEPSLVSEIVSGVKARGMFSSCEAVVGGYLGKAETGQCLLQAVEQVKQANRNSLFFCDPVMGDREKGLYVADDVVRFYKDHGGPAADILKPNAFELEVLSEASVLDPDTAIAAARPLIHAWALKAMVVSSVPVPAQVRQDRSPAIACMVITKDEAWVVETPLLPLEQKGAGDAFMAFFVANALRSGCDFAGALGLSASSIWSVMNIATQATGQELPLVSGQKEFLQPSHIFKAKALNQTTH